MTNTLHRFGDAESFRDDFVIFAIASRGKNEQGALEKLREFLRLETTKLVPDHSWLSKTRARLPLEVHEAVFAWVLERLA